MHVSILKFGKTTLTALTFLFLFSLTTGAVEPTARKTVQRKPATKAGNSIQRSPAGQDAGERVLKVKGQSRNLNMMLILRGENDHVEFGETRKNYREEVIKTQY